MAKFLDTITGPYGGNVFTAYFLFVAAGIAVMAVIGFLLNSFFPFGKQILLASGILIQVMFIVSVLFLMLRIALGGVQDNKNLFLSAMIIALGMIFIWLVVPKLAPEMFQQSILQTKTVAMSMLNIG